MGPFPGIGLLLLVVAPLVSLSLLLSGTGDTAARAAIAVDKPVSSVLPARDGGPPLIASPAKPVGYDAQVTTQTDPAGYVGLIQKGGATSLRDDVSWPTVEPAQGYFDWTVPDGLVTQAAEHHLHPLLIVDGTPAWASGGSMTDPDWYWLPPASATAYGDFAAAVAARYGPFGAFWKEHPKLPAYLPAGIELWNEENLSLFWGGENPNPKVYAAMVNAAYPRIKKADPTMTVLLGGLSPAGAYDDVTCSRRKSTGHEASAWNGVNYLQALYADGIHGHFDAVGWHAYNFWTGATATQMLANDSCSAWSQMSATPVSVRSLMTAHGDAGKKVWITEAGAPTCTTGVTYTPCVSLAQQAALATIEAKWRSLSWAGGYYWYDVRDDSTGTQKAAAHFGALYANDSPKPVYQVLRKAWG